MICHNRHVSDAIAQQHTMYHIMVCCNNRHLLCHNNMSQHMMSHAMTQHALCHVLWHNSIQCHSIIFWNKMQYVVACYASVNSMSWHSMSKRQALCHDMVCHINRYHIIPQYATTISMLLQHM